MPRKIHLFITVTIICLTFLGSFISFFTPAKTTAEKDEPFVLSKESYKEGKYMVVYLDRMLVELKDGETVLSQFPIISQGKPGSYYETVGGEYLNDYKTPLHFSSIGHVYMPYSIHVFGNYFIHGIPYYPDGRKVSSEYSGGCIRLNDEDIKKVYSFIEKGTPIIITRDKEDSFSKTASTSATLLSSQLTHLMVATISLEALTQDSPLHDGKGNITTRKNILPILLSKRDTSITPLLTRSMGEENFVALMNKKALILGMSNTRFTDTTSPVWTTNEDYDRFMNYIDTYKSYLRTVQNTSTSPAL